MAHPGKERVSKGDDESLPRVVMQDLRSDLAGNIGRDLRDLYRFFIDSATRERLESMGKIPKAFWIVGWLIKSLLLKLSPARRVLLLLAMILALMGWTEFTWGSLSINYDLRPWGFLLLLFVLMLELKDKLLAKDEIQVARQVQLALQPREHPDLTGWEIWSYSVPANDVGGDLVDYIELGPDRLGVALGDVAGKGLGAALLAAKLQATLRALGPDSPSLDELGLRVNAILHNDGLPNRYATLFYIELSPDSGHTRYLNAGHNPPFLVRNDGVELLGASSFPVGMLLEAGYSEGVLELASGDTLVVYSDGLTEATDRRGNEFGEDRLRDLLPRLARETVDQAGRSLIREVESFLDGERPHDDLSVVVLRRS